MSSIYLHHTRFFTYRPTLLNVCLATFVLLGVATVAFLVKNHLVTINGGVPAGVIGTEIVPYDRTQNLDISKSQSQNARLTTQGKFTLQYVQQTPFNNGKPAWRAKNSGANIEAYFFEDGPIILPSNPDMGRQFKIHPMRLALVNKPYIPHSIPKKPNIKITGNKIEYQRGILTEWYINDERGLEHGLIINDHELFHNQDSLTVWVEIEGLNHTRGQVIDSRNLKFRSKLNRGSLNYSHLVVEDRTGKLLLAEFDLKGTQIAIIVDIRSAKFPINIDPLITTTNWETKGSGLFGESYGHAVASVGDVTGNGFDDVLVSDQKSEGSPSNNLLINRGTVYLYEGSATGLSFSPVWSYTESQLDSTATIGAKYGFALAAAGDIDQDGFNDFIVGANEYSSPTKDYVGRVYVYLGAKDGVLKTPFMIESEVGSGTNFGTSVAAADVNGDGRNDLIVGHPQFDNLLAAGLDEGRVLVYLANPATVYNPLNPQTLFKSTAIWSYAATGDKAGFGTHVANAGDVNADGYDDIIIGSPGYTNGQSLEGAAYIFYGGAGGTTDVNPWMVESDQIDALLGLRVAGVGDVNGDTIADVMVSAIGWDAIAPSEGKADLYLGVKKEPGVAGGPSLTTATWTYLGGSESSNLNSIAAAGDVNGDGFGDVIVGLQAYSNPESLEGRVLLFEGTPTGLKSMPTWDRESNVVSGQIGFSVGGGGDFNGDGYSDIITGAPGVNTVGTAYAFYGAGNSDLEVIVTDSVDPVLPSTDFTYTLSITNYGPDPAKKVVLVNTLPNTAIFKSVTADINWVCNELMLEITCTTDNIAANAATSIINIILQFPTSASAITNVAAISANIVDANVTNNTDSEVTQINTPPVATAITFRTDEDVKYTATQPALYLKGSDPDSDPLSFSLDSQAIKGVAVVQLNGGFSYQPNPDFNGSDAFSFSVSDGITTASATVNIIVNAINDAPVAKNNSFKVIEDTVYSLGVLTASDIDTANNLLGFSLNKNAQQGDVVINSDGTYTYTPNANYNGSDSFSFIVSDNSTSKLSSTGTVSITVLAANDPPIVPLLSFATQEETPLNGQLQASDDITPANLLTYRTVANAGPSKGNVDILPSGSFTYTPFLNKIGSDSFDFEVTDTGNPALSTIATVTITISNTNDAPVAEALVMTPFDEDTPASGQVLATDAETPTVQLLFSLETSATNGNVLMQNDGSFEYTPLKDFSGTDSFVFKVEDNSVPRNSATATVSITVNPVNDPPMALDGNINIIQNQVWGAFLLGDDVENDSLQYALLTPPAKGSVDIYDASIGAYTYTPKQNAIGPDSFTFKVFDGQNYSDENSPGKISVFINGLSDGNVDPSSPTLISPSTSSNDVNATGVVFSWQASVDPDSNNLTYKVALCVEDPSVTCAAITANNLRAAIDLPTLFALSSPGAGLLLLGLMGGRRRKYWRQVLLIIGVIVVVSACSNAAEEAQKSPFVKKAPLVVTHYATNLLNAKTYYWKVIVADGDGGISESEIRSFTTKPSSVE